jgi:hypothetical protein
MPSSRKRNYGKPNPKQAQGPKSINQKKQAYAPFGLTADLNWVATIYRYNLHV